MLKICLVFWKSEPHYAYKRYAYKRKNMYLIICGFFFPRFILYIFTQKKGSISYITCFQFIVLFEGTLIYSQ